MSPQLTTNGHTAQYIPAWRRIGLKLKLPEDEIADVTTHVEQNDKRAKRTAREAAISDPHPVPPSKKLKRPTPQPTTTDLRCNDSRTSSSPQPRKQKSVAFTPETKVEDGDSVKQLFKAWVAEQKTEDLSSHAEDIVKTFKFGAPRSRLGKGAKERSQEVQKQGRGKFERAASRTTSVVNGTHLHSAIVYLLDHHRSRDNWKFNKAKQSYLLKHLFDFDKIPADYNEALREYIAGLQGHGARNRVREAIEEIKAEETGENTQTEDPIAGMGRMAKRADWLLSALGAVGEDAYPARANTTATGDDSQEGLKANKGLAKGRGRKRKKRTLSKGSEDSSNSSSSSLSSTDSSDSDSSDDSSSGSSSSDSSSSTSSNSGVSVDSDS